MSENILNIELITSLVDREITDPEKVDELNSLIESNDEFRFEYQIQKLMKRLVTEKVGFKPAPEQLKTKIENSINPEKKSKFKFFHFIQNIFSKPVLAYGGAVIILIAFLLLIFNRTPQVDYKNFAVEQQGPDNMFVQAKNNFQLILEGKLRPQVVSSKPNEVKEYFKTHGVKYSTFIPQYNNFQLLGGVISEDEGEKFAHHVYTGDEGKLVYLFQVNEKYIENYKILKLTDDLINYLDKGNCYISTSETSNTLMTKSHNNIFAVVSNISADELEAQFCMIN